jgi:AraC family transcriptional regulator
MSRSISSSLEKQEDDVVSLPQKSVDTLPGCKLRRVIEYIQENLDKPLTIVELGAVVCISPYHFARLFKGSTGLPPHQFVVRQRIAQASALLETRELTVAQIARMVGFRTSSHFTTVFHRVTGITPRACRSESLRDDQYGLEGG